MLTRVVTFNDGEYSVRITLRAATILDGAVRSILVDEGLLANRAVAEGEELTIDSRELARRLLRVYAYPNCIAALESIENLDGAQTPVPERPTFEEWVMLPQQLFLDWSQAALELNPQWRLESEIGGEDEKKEESVKNSSL